MSLLDVFEVISKNTVKWKCGNPTVYNILDIGLHMGHFTDHLNNYLAIRMRASIE